jgi:hypothetical protein
MRSVGFFWHRCRNYLICDKVRCVTPYMKIYLPQVRRTGPDDTERLRQGNRDLRQSRISAVCWCVVSGTRLHAECLTGRFGETISLSGSGRDAPIDDHARRSAIAASRSTGGNSLWLRLNGRLEKGPG